MKKIIGKLFTALAVLAFLSGCANVPQQSFDREKNQHIKTIALLGVPEPKEYMAFNIGGTGSAFGLIGGLVEGSIAASNSQALTKALQENDTNLGQNLQNELAKKLEKAGYEVIVLNGIRPEHIKDQPDYSKISTEADAILDVQHFVSGYIAPAWEPDYKLWIRVGAKMISSKTQETIYHQIFNYGEELNSQLDKIIYLPESQPKAYPNFESLMANTSSLKQSLQESSQVISGSIVSHL